MTKIDFSLIKQFKCREALPDTMSYQFSVPQIEYPLGGSSKKCSHVYFLLIVAMILLLWHQESTIVTSGHHGSTKTTFI